jgi:hypothetical protein
MRTLLLRSAGLRDEIGSGFISFRLRLIYVR